jgi:hypothetical protein
MQDIGKQMAKQRCLNCCSQPLRWKQIPCPICRIWYFYGPGCLHWIHTGEHNHTEFDFIRPTAQGQEELQKIVDEHPDATPLQILSGIPTLTRTTKPASDIDPAFGNQGRLKKHITKIKEAE